MVTHAVDARAERSTPEPSPAVVAAATASHLQLPMAFEPNRGQTDARVQFLTRGAGYTLFLSGTEAVLALGRASENTSAAVEGKVGGTKLEVVIRPLGGKRYALEAEGRRSGTGPVRPVTVHLAIGNDEGSTSVRPKRH